MARSIVTLRGFLSDRGNRPGVSTHFPLRSIGRLVDERMRGLTRITTGGVIRVSSWDFENIKTHILRAQIEKNKYEQWSSTSSGVNLLGCLDWLIDIISKHLKWFVYTENKKYILNFSIGYCCFTSTIRFRPSNLILNLHTYMIHKFVFFLFYLPNQNDGFWQHKLWPLFFFSKDVLFLCLKQWCN